MSSLLTSDEIAFFTGSLALHFDTFTHDRTRLIIVHKEPIKTIVSNPVNPIYGYGDNSASTSINYTPVSGIFPAMISDNLIQSKIKLEDINNMAGKGQARIKVEQNARDFIEDGRKNENIEFDNKRYNLISADGVQNYMGLIYYIYKLENTL